ncbi:MAG: hypothetical protein H6835_18070 [Planctomycetes bacterium]|nr:hypothetical protein [Planctomycetota bacterium]
MSEPRPVAARALFAMMFLGAVGASSGVCRAQRVKPPVGDREGVGVRAASVERNGVTWQFSVEHVVGRYANGDPWVVGPVAIVGLLPPCVETEGRTRNGAMIDPDPATMQQGYDSALFGEPGDTRYDKAKNVALGLSSSSPLTLAVGQSLVSVIGREAFEGPPVLRRAAVLTCVAAPPPPDAFRPPYVKGDKAMPYRVADLDWSALRKLASIDGTPSIDAIAHRFATTWLDHFPGWVVRYTHPLDDMPDYGRDLGSLVGTAALLLNLDLPDAQKRPLLVAFVQFGLDLHAALRAGCRWRGLGGHGHGRKLPILFAGQLLHDERMLAIGGDFDSAPAQAGGQGGWFGEDTQTFFVTETSAGEWNWGFGGYTKEQDGLPEWGFAHADHPDRDDARWEGNPYRRCCTANAWLGQALCARAMGLVEAWRHDAFFAYVDRYQQVVHAEDWHRAWDSWQARMWDTYRAGL